MAAFKIWIKFGFAEETTQTAFSFGLASRHMILSADTRFLVILWPFWLCSLLVVSLCRLCLSLPVQLAAGDAPRCASSTSARPATSITGIVCASLWHTNKLKQILKLLLSRSCFPLSRRGRAGRWYRPKTIAFFRYFCFPFLVLLCPAFYQAKDAQLTSLPSSMWFAEVRLLSSHSSMRFSGGGSLASLEKFTVAAVCVDHTGYKKAIKWWLFAIIMLMATSPSNPRIFPDEAGLIL